MQNANGSLATSYDETPYSSYVFSHCQPVRLHAIATLKGLNPAPVETARVLEIGCSFGGNLLPFAIQHPRSYSIGIDLSEQQINMGKKMMQEVGVDNIQLICADISQVNFENIQFDYIICHGVFSWVPQFVQEAILNVIKNYLSPNGVAFISYNTYPGWHHFDAAKHLMQFGSNPQLDRLTRTDQAFELLKYTNNILKKTNTPRDQSLEAIFNTIIGREKYYVSHEYFEEYNNPLYFSQFLEKINKYHLAYLNDSDVIDFWRYFPSLDNKEYNDICDYFGYDLEKIEEYFDFLSNRAFRCSIITHQSNLAHHNIGKDIRSLNLAYQFNRLYFQTNIAYIEQTETTPAYWQLTDNGKLFSSNPLSDKLFEYIHDHKEKLCSISALKEYLIANTPSYDEQDTNNILLNIIYSSRTYFSFSDIPLNTYSKKPKINEKYRKLSIFVEKNPNVTGLSNYRYQRIETDFFTSYICKHLDGTRTIKNLIKLIKSDIDNGSISWTIDGEKITSQQLDDNEIKDNIVEALDILYAHGYFNHYDNESH